MVYLGGRKIALMLKNYLFSCGTDYKMKIIRTKKEGEGEEERKKKKREVEHDALGQW